MKRCFCFLLLLAAVLLAEPQGSLPLMAADLEGTETPAPTDRQIVEEPAAPSRMDAEPDRREERKSRRGIGADFWGGPYWGYGPRWGHPCEACRATCEYDAEGARCERCRIRCGW